MNKFFQLCLDSLMTIDFNVIKCCILASPGFVKDEFFEFIKE